MSVILDRDNRGCCLA